MKGKGKGKSKAKNKGKQKGKGKNKGKQGKGKDLDPQRCKMVMDIGRTNAHRRSIKFKNKLQLGQ